MKRLNKDSRSGVPDLKVYVLNVAKLDRMRILYKRSDELVRQTGGEVYRENKALNGMKFAWSDHFLVYGWVPTQCIENVWDANTYRLLCSQAGIREGQKADR